MTEMFFWMIIIGAVVVASLLLVVIFLLFTIIDSQDRWEEAIEQAADSLEEDLAKGKK